MNIDWDGKGLPPVGLEVEARFPKSILTSWTRFTLMYLSDYTLVYKTLNEVCCEPAAFERQEVEFRPVKTLEQLQEEKRKKDIDDMYKVFYDAPGLAAKEGVAALYDAGYRKFEIVEEDV